MGLAEKAQVEEPLSNGTNLLNHSQVASDAVGRVVPGGVLPVKPAQTVVKQTF